MHATESIEQFLQLQPAPLAAAGRFNVYDRQQFCNGRRSFSRRDFFKINLMTGTGRLHYPTRSVELDRPALVFSNPRVPFSWEPTSPEQGGYFCLFTEDFLSGSERSASLHESPLFKPGSELVVFVDEQQFETLAAIFRKMLAEMATEYPFKQELLRTYLHLLIHEALKLQPPPPPYQHPNAAARIVASFQELLEQQFPVDAPDHGLRLRTPGDFARRLSVHVNHLNKAVREQTGKSTSAHIAERIVTEARALLQHTPWSTAEVAYGLGFEYPNYFNNFFKKHTGLTPSGYRARLASAAGAPAAAD